MAERRINHKAHCEHVLGDSAQAARVRRVWQFCGRGHYRPPIFGKKITPRFLSIVCLSLLLTKWKIQDFNFKK
jgi:hypothetical protein